jgi:acyl carrier protein
MNNEGSSSLTGQAQAAAPDAATVEKRVIEIVARCLDRKPSEVGLDSRLWGELSAESLDMLDIVYSLERAFIIRLPRLNLLQRARELFGEDTVVADGVITPAGLELMRLSMPEIPAASLTPNMGIQEFRYIITVESFVRVVHRCLEAKARIRCACGGLPAPVPDSPMELRCAACGAPLELPSGEQLLVDDLVQAGKALNLHPPGFAETAAVPLK